MTKLSPPQWQAPFHIITMGGTIDKSYFDTLSDYQVGEPQAPSVLQDIHLLSQFKLTSVCAKDSLDLTTKDRQQLVEHINASPFEQILITHGTDAMVDTATYLEQHLPVEHGFKIVLVGAMHPARFKNSDATFNIGFALGALRLVGPGCYIAMNGAIFTSGSVRKNRQAQQFQAISVQEHD